MLDLHVGYVFELWDSRGHASIAPWALVCSRYIRRCEERKGEVLGGFVGPFSKASACRRVKGLKTTTRQPPSPITSRDGSMGALRGLETAFILPPMWLHIASSDLGAQMLSGPKYYTYAGLVGPSTVMLGYVDPLGHAVHREEGFDALVPVPEKAGGPKAAKAAYAPRNWTSIGASHLPQHGP